jgi:arabinan endo-1,5-alpha-L-arabinosidase
VSVWGDADPGIGVATAEDPAGPFTDEGPLLTSREIGVPNSIDPSVFASADGAHHLVWGSLDGEPTRIAGDAWEAVKIEERDGVYWLFGSLGSCCEGMASTYRIAVGRADELTGPYV